MKNGQTCRFEGYFRINGKGAQLVFANNNGKVQTPIDPKSGLPMLTMFHNIDEKQIKQNSFCFAILFTADRLELAVLSKFQLGSVIEIDAFPLVQVCFSATSSMRALCATRTLDELYENLK